jgi:hypothetical protein
MTANAERADVLQVALTAALHHWHNVICVPEGASLARFQPPFRPSGQTFRTAGTAELQKFGAAVDSTSRTDSAVALENLVSQITGVSPHLPLVHAPGGAECNSTLGHFEIAPAAEVPAIWPLRQRTAIDPAARHDARGAHYKHFKPKLFGATSGHSGVYRVWHHARVPSSQTTSVSCPSAPTLRQHVDRLQPRPAIQPSNDVACAWWAE